MFDPRNIALYEELLKVAEEKIALDPATMKTLLTGLGGGVAVGLPTYLLTRMHDNAEKKRAQNRAFGAGMAAGVTTPKILKGLLSAAQRNGLVTPGAP